MDRAIHSMYPRSCLASVLVPPITCRTSAHFMCSAMSIMTHITPDIPTAPADTQIQMQHINSARNFTNGTSQTSHGVILPSRRSDRRRGAGAWWWLRLRVRGGDERERAKGEWRKVSDVEIDLRHEPVPELGAPGGRPTTSLQPAVGYIQPSDQLPSDLLHVGRRRGGRRRDACGRKAPHRGTKRRNRTGRDEERANRGVRSSQAWERGLRKSVAQ